MRHLCVWLVGSSLFGHRAGRGLSSSHSLSPFSLPTPRVDVKHYFFSVIINVSITKSKTSLSSACRTVKVTDGFSYYGM